MVIRNFGQRPYTFSQNLQLTEKLMRLLIGFFAVFFSVVSASAEDILSAAIASIDADVVFMRHALAPGFGDPTNFAIEHCATQRNLDNVGRKQAMEIGAEMRLSATNFTEVLSSEWCRCKETAELLGLGPWVPFSGLNSFFQDFADKDVVLKKLEQKLRQLEPGVTLMVTHQVVITSVTAQAVRSGEFIAFNTRTKEARKFRLD
jgi:phosphohistidine phosphatase SixA